MKYAIISDIHGNLEALETVLADIKLQNIEVIACLGDIVGYGPNPKECLDIIRGLKIPSVKGNHDEYCSSDDPPERFQPHDAKTVQWTRDQLTSEDRRWLRDLKYTFTVANFTIVHATLNAPGRWEYIFDKLAAAASFPFQNTPLCFFGHTHTPVAFARDATGVRGSTYSKLKIDPTKKYFINPGAVGQPRERDPRASYTVYDREAGTIELRRVDYDFRKTQQKIRDAGI